MKVRRCARIQADGFGDIFDGREYDPEHDAATDTYRFNPAMAETIVGKLMRLQFKVEAFEYGEHGWFISIRDSDYYVSIELQEFDDEHIFISNGRARVLADMLNQLNEEMKKDPRFRKVCWFTLDELDGDSPGADTPADEVPLPRAPQQRPGLLSKLFGRPKSAPEDRTAND